MSREKVALGLPYYRNFEGATVLCLMQMIASSTEFLSVMPIRTNGGYIEENRNRAVQFALDTGIEFDWFMWIDSDMIFPQDTLLRLIAHDKDIVGCNYRSRTPPFNSVGWYLNADPMEIMFEPGLHEMGHLPTGVLLTRFDLYRKLSAPWFDAALSPKPRDDVYFCNRARENGYKVWCDHDLTFKVRHIDTQEIPWFEPGQIVYRDGTQMNTVTGMKESRERAAKVRETYGTNLERM